MHHHRWERNGDPLKRRTLIGEPLTVRLMARRVITAEGCWEYSGARNGDGYGMIGRGGPGNVGKTHRVAYELYVGPIPRGLHVLHRCDNPPCFNPEHLTVGTNADNLADRDRKGRGNFTAGLAVAHARMRKRTACNRGHLYTAANTYTYTRRGSVERVCKTCRRSSVVKVPQ